MINIAKLTRWLGICIFWLCIIEAVSGIALIFQYRANPAEAFNSLQTLIFSEHWPWFWHAVHVWGVNCLLVFSYSYVFTLLCQKRFAQPLAWTFTIALLVLILITSYLGNILPYSQLSSWLMKATPFLDLKAAFLSHVILAPLLLVVGFVVWKIVKSDRDKVALKTSGLRTAITIIVFLAVFFLLTLIFPDLFSSPLHALSASVDAQPLYYAPPWYLAAWFALYKSLSGWGLLIIVALIAALPYLLKLTFVNRHPQIYGLMLGLILLGFLALTAYGYYFSGRVQSSATAQASHIIDRPVLPAHNNLNDAASLQHGARNFMNYCAGCHSLQHVTYEQMARRIHLYDAQHEIYYDLLEQNLIFSGEPASAFIRSAITPSQAQRWLGDVPPDLTSIVRIRGVNWVYTYLNSFYRDPARPWGVNNLLVRNTYMPDVLYNLQGEQAIIYQQDGSGDISHLQLRGNGSMTPAQFQEFTRDIVNFLAAVAQPPRPYKIQLAFWLIVILLAGLLGSYLWYARK